MASKEITPKERSACTWDAVSLGEVMLRFDPGEGRVRSSRNFCVWEGGGEYNVIRSLHRCFGLRTALVTAIPRNELGLLLEDLIAQGGVDTSWVNRVPYDGMGLSNRQGLNFVERGFGLRGAKGVSDRGYTATSAMKPGDIDWKCLFNDAGVRWFHCGGIFSALSDTTAEVALEAMEVAKGAGTIVSYDLNYRHSLWQSRGGPERAREVNLRLLPLVDLLLGNEEDFEIALGFKTHTPSGVVGGATPERYGEVAQAILGKFPTLKAIATSLRLVKSASLNDWGGILQYGVECYHSEGWKNLEIMDRVGGGDSFASGIIYGFLTGAPPQRCLEYGVAHGALAMTTPGDTSMATLDEVDALIEGGGTRIQR